MQLNRKRLYWVGQLGGWALYLLLNMFFLYLGGKWRNDMLQGLLFIFLAGIALTQLFRFVVIRFDWLRLPVGKAIIYVLPFNLLMGAIVVSTQVLLERLVKLSLYRDFSSGVDPVKVSVNILNYTFVFFAWSLIYFLVHYIENYKKAEIENLRRQAAVKEIELNKLKSQLNPHFMFNSMNSIRALVDEDPVKAKESVTQLSNILRNTLMMGRSKLISFEDECRIVRDYLALESTRLEERLRIEWNIEPGSERFEVPPLMIQTLVENAIKHGISKLTGGGTLSISTHPETEGLEVLIRNSGQFDESKKPETGFGLINTIQRLELLYGSRAGFSIGNEDDNTVVTRIFIPQFQQS